MKSTARLGILLLGLTACQGTGGKVPEGRIDTRVHPEFTQFRPVAVAVLPTAAPVFDLRMKLRGEVYQRLFDKQYSPIRLQTVDANFGRDGAYTGADLEWDATLSMTVTKWRGVPGRDQFLGSGAAKLTHKSGEVLWECRFDDEAFEVESREGTNDFSDVAASMATLVLDRLPDRPPLPRE